MSEISQKIARRVGYAIFWPLLVGLPLALFAKGIDIQAFIAVASLWLIVSLFLIIGPDSISEITIWKASIKRDVKAAREARDEAEAIRDELRKVARLNIENVFLLNSLLANFFAGPSGTNALPPAFGHIAKNLEEMSPLISSDEKVIAEWQGKLRQIIRTSPPTPLEK
ncbi:hypothetical protein FEA48_21090 [Pseudomonas nitroreducens]|uniref:Uncharacterized protein n=1 Tax=Pseudomonas nitroreducens TaxID=46680 RepID=A0A5R8ZY13_PSENT|nr:hypothetical protein [Pseudomonas nitroreducens]TLP71323.1 hypothetical protein FEA48_21090 [Pseudomonas nitroreducens]